MDACVNKCYEYEAMSDATKRVRIILDKKYEKIDLSKTIIEQYQHLTVTNKKNY